MTVQTILIDCGGHRSHRHGAAQSRATQQLNTYELLLNDKASGLLTVFLQGSCKLIAWLSPQKLIRALSVKSDVLTAIIEAGLLLILLDKATTNQT